MGSMPRPLSEIKMADESGGEEGVDKHRNVVMKEDAYRNEIK